MNEVDCCNWLDGKLFQVTQENPWMALFEKIVLMLLRQTHRIGRKGRRRGQKKKKKKKKGRKTKRQHKAYLVPSKINDYAWVCAEVVEEIRSLIPVVFDIHKHARLVIDMFPAKCECLFQFIELQNLYTTRIGIS